MSVFNFINFKDYFKKVNHINYFRFLILAILVFIINTSFSSCNLFNNKSNEITDSIEIYNLPTATKIPSTTKTTTTIIVR